MKISIQLHETYLIKITKKESRLFPGLFPGCQNIFLII